MSKVSVDINQPSPYIESSSILHTFKRRLTYVFAIKMIKKYADIRNFNSLLEIGTGSGFFMLSCKKNFSYYYCLCREQESNRFQLHKVF